MVTRAGLSRRTRLLVIIYAAFLAALLVLAFFAHADPCFAWDLRWELAWQAVSMPGLARAMYALTWLGDDWHPFAVVALVFGVLALRGDRATAVAVVASDAGGQLLGLLIKLAVRRARPSEAGIHIMRHRASFSFPSGHVVQFMAFYGFLFALTFLYVRRGALCTAVHMLLAALVTGIGPSRVYVGEHWPSDVIGAYLVGLCWLAVAVPLYHHWRARRVDTTGGEGA